MFARRDKPRLPFTQALKVYWLYLVGLAAFHFMIVFAPALVEHRGVLMGTFFAVASSAMWPCLFRDAPYSFWIFACIYWVVGAVLMLLLKVALATMIGNS